LHTQKPKKKKPEPELDEADEGSSTFSAENSRELKERRKEPSSSLTIHLKGLLPHVVLDFLNRPLLHLLVTF
jgi:hypothetical protein